MIIVVGGAGSGIGALGLSDGLAGRGESAKLLLSFRSQLCRLRGRKAACSTCLSRCSTSFSAEFKLEFCESGHDGRDRSAGRRGGVDSFAQGAKRVVRSTRVPIAELSSPRIRSPSQCPGTARSSASAGRWLIMTSGVTNRLPRPRLRALGTRSARPVRRQAHNSRRSAPRPWT